MQMPSIQELVSHPIVIRALDVAWADSFSEDPLMRHEEGGWIYFRPDTNELITRRAPSGEIDSIKLGYPIVIPGWYIIGMYHTHPNPTAEGWNPEPSIADRQLHKWAGVPGIVRSDRGIHLCGPDARCDGLKFGEGFPRLGDDPS